MTPGDNGLASRIPFISTESVWILHWLLALLSVGMVALIGWFFTGINTRINALELGQEQMACQHVLMQAHIADLAPCNLTVLHHRGAR